MNQLDGEQYTGPSELGCVNLIVDTQQVSDPSCRHLGMPPQSAVDAWQTWMRASHFSGETVVLRTTHIRKVLSEIGMSERPWDVSAEQLLDFFARQSWKANTARSYRASLRSFYGWARDAGLVEASPAHLLPRIAVPRGVPRPTTEAAYAVALSGSSHAVTIGLMLAGDCGLRRSEIARVTRESVVPDLLGFSLRVVGKGGHVRMVPLSSQLAAMMLAQPPGWLFPSPRRPGMPLTPAVVGRYLSRRLPGEYTTHNLRHRAGTVALAENGGDLRAVQELLGHAKPETTALYTFVAPERVRAAMLGAVNRRLLETGALGLD